MQRERESHWWRQKVVETAAREGGGEEQKKWNSQGLGLLISKTKERMDTPDYKMNSKNHIGLDLNGRNCNKNLLKLEWKSGYN